MNVVEAVAVFLIVSGVAAYFINNALDWKIPAESLISLGVGLIGGQYAGRYLQRQEKGD
ncbi:MAG: hypothetical protein QW304_07955 [Thermoproteota archaeon]